MNFLKNLLKNTDWRDIHDEYYGDGKEKKSKPVIETFGKASTRKPQTVILENEDEIIECASQREASYHLGCSEATVRKNANKPWGFRGFKITKFDLNELNKANEID